MNYEEEYKISGEMLNRLDAGEDRLHLRLGLLLLQGLNSEDRLRCRFHQYPRIK